MQRLIMRALLLALVCSTATKVVAQEFTTDPVAWEASVEGISFPVNYEALIKPDGTSVDANEFFNEPIANDQPLGWGSMSQDSQDFDGIVFEGVVIQTANGFIYTTPLEGAPVKYNLDAVHGVLNGFSFRYGQTPAIVRVFNGDTLIDSVVTVPGQPDPDTLPETYICWENTTGELVTRIEFEPTPGSVAAAGIPLAVLNGEFRFEMPDPQPESSYDDLESISTDLAILSDSLSRRDRRRAGRALSLVNWMQQDDFWVLPEGERLSSNGAPVFYGAAFAIRYLNQINDPAADQLAEDLVDVLEQVVDAEIDYAIETGGSSASIDRAIDLAEIGEIVDEDFDNDVIASLVYRAAWLNAVYATE